MNLNQILWICDNNSMNGVMKYLMAGVFIISFALFTYGVWKIGDCCLNSKKNKKNKKIITRGVVCIIIALILLAIFLLNINVYSC